MSQTSGATRLKRKLPAECYPDKQCKWCEQILVRKRQSLSEWKNINTCGGSCGANWGTKKITKKAFELQELSAPLKYCNSCEALLVRKPDEKTSAWHKRNNCNKSCAATSANQAKKAIEKPSIIDDHARLGVVQYKRDSDEFKRIAALYGG